MHPRFFRGLAAGAAALLLSVGGAALAGPPSSTPETSLVGVVNVNTATDEELQLLPGIGPSRARAVLEYRKTHGAFKSVDELTSVSGIGERALDKIRQHCVLKGKTTVRLEQ